MAVINSKNIAKIIPDALKNLTDYIKTTVQENAKDTISNSSGTIGVLLKLFAEPLVDRYLESVKDKKMKSYGTDIYIKASLAQGIESFKKINQESSEKKNENNIMAQIASEAILWEVEKLKSSKPLILFQPKYHPSAIFVKDVYTRIFHKLKYDQEIEKQFLKDFNTHIEGTVRELFGTAFEEHLKLISVFHKKDNEADMLWDMAKLGRIGFNEDEDLKYEDTFAYWSKLSRLNSYSDVEFKSDIENEESKLRPIEKLIENYFDTAQDKPFESILFVVADFGKGKSVFLKHYTSLLATKYIETGEGYIPIYFNLRNFKNYSSETKLGVIGDFLETTYAIRIDDEYFKKNKYLFLIDSLDESGELNKTNIEKVISSVKKIQLIDKTSCRDNRIIITTRPFEDGLEYQINSHNPLILRLDDKEVPHYLSIYGFKKKQFNNWLKTALIGHDFKNRSLSEGLLKQIIDNISTKSGFDIHNKLMEKGTLSWSELRRPIFSYMIYKLILNEIDFFAMGKIGVYLSFLNLLTKDAKYVYDRDHRINLKEQIEARNILHATAALWMRNKKAGGQGSLKKADLCRVIEGVDKKESDVAVLQRYKESEVEEIQFLSHSYFGENDNTLHFQHQSFAEILVAEYYLKILIKYSLDQGIDIEDARLRFNLGEPTGQTIQFLSEMLSLIKDSAKDSASKEILEKRRLLFYLLSSSGTERFNKELFCNNIYYQWLCRIDDLKGESTIPIDLLKEWGVKQVQIDKMIELCRGILDSKTTYLRLQGESKSPLFSNEVFQTQAVIANIAPDIDKWIALLTGNILFNCNFNFFCSTLYDPRVLFDLIRNWNFYSMKGSPPWATDLFKGIKIPELTSEINISHLNLSGIDFSYSRLCNIKGFYTFLHMTKFDICEFHNVDFTYSIMVETSLIGCNFNGLKFTNALVLPNIVVPYSLVTKFPFAITHSSFASLKVYFNPKAFVLKRGVYFSTLFCMIIYLEDNKLVDQRTIEDCFIFSDEKDKALFFKELSKYRVNVYMPVLEDYKKMNSSAQNVSSVTLEENWN